MTDFVTILRDTWFRMLNGTATRKNNLAQQSVLQINGAENFTNARLSFEEDLMISYENEEKKRSVIYYPWEKVSTMAYL